MSPAQRENLDELDPLGVRANTGYMPVEHYGLLGTMHTSALVATDAGLDFMCWPNFDSPAVFCRMLDKDRGGTFAITPRARHAKGILTTKQQYLQHPEALDSACLIAPLAFFFVASNDPRFTNTLNRTLKSPDQGGLTSNGMVYRYNLHTSNDGLAGDEGAFSMCTFWMVEALTRAGAYEEQYLDKAVTLFENAPGYANHLGMFSEEISKSGEQLGNTPQAFSHLALISAAFNLDRVTKGHSW